MKGWSKCASWSHLKVRPAACVRRGSYVRKRAAVPNADDFCLIMNIAKTIAI